MAAPAFLALPYHVARTPLAVLDMTVVSRLPQESAVRRNFAKAFGSLDLLAGRVFADQSLLRQGAERMAAGAPATPSAHPRPTPDRTPAETRPSATPETDESEQDVIPDLEQAGPATFGPAPAAKKAAAKKAPAKKAAAKRPAPAAGQARDEVLARELPADTRSNKNLSTIRQQLAQTEAVAEAHEHRAEERAGDDASS